MLCQGSHDGQKHLAFGIQGVDILLLEEHRNVQRLQLPRVLEAVQGVSRKSADGLGEDQVDLSGFAVCTHAVELVSFGCIGA